MVRTKSPRSLSRGAAILAAIGLVLAPAMLTGCSSSTDAQPAETVKAPKPKPVKKKKVEPLTFTVVGTGDVLSHRPVVEHSRQSDGRYDYAPLVKAIKPYIEGADLGLCHQEIPFTRDNAKISGYPVFHAPAGWAKSTKELGYDGCSMASNHTWDGGRQGIEDTISILKENGLGSSGADSSADQNPIQYYEITKGGRTVKVAHLSFTYGLNYESVPEVNKNPWLVHINDPDYMIELAKKARSEGKADVVIVAPHGGTEYAEKSNEQQRGWAKKFAESKVIDLYLGHHAHVPQPMEKYEGGPDGKGMWAFYGVGNLLSNMKPNQGIGTQTGIIAHVTITVPEKGPAHVDEASWVGLLLDTASNQIFLAHNYNQGDHPGSHLSNGTAQSYYQHLKGVMGDGPERTEAPEKAAEPAKVIER